MALLSVSLSVCQWIGSLPSVFGVGGTRLGMYLFYFIDPMTVSDIMNATCFSNQNVSKIRVKNKAFEALKEEKQQRKYVSCFKYKLTP